MPLGNSRGGNNRCTAIEKCVCRSAECPDDRRRRYERLGRLPGWTSGCEDSQHRSVGSSWHAVFQRPLCRAGMQSVASRHADWKAPPVVPASTTTVRSGTKRSRISRRFHSTSRQMDFTWWEAARCITTCLASTDLATGTTILIKSSMVITRIDCIVAWMSATSASRMVFRSTDYRVSKA